MFRPSTKAGDAKTQKRSPILEGLTFLGRNNIERDKLKYNVVLLFFKYFKRVDSEIVTRTETFGVL